jgi:hypothetical protein
MTRRAFIALLGRTSFVRPTTRPRHLRHIWFGGWYGLGASLAGGMPRWLPQLAFCVVAIEEL